MRCSMEPVSKRAKSTISGIHWSSLMLKTLGRHSQTISLIDDKSFSTLFLMSICHFKHRSLHVYVQNLPKSSECLQMPGTVHDLTLSTLTISLLNKMCLLLLYSKPSVPSLECWPSISLHDWQSHIIQEPVKSELAQDKSVESSTFLPVGVRYIIFNCLWGTVWDFIVFQLLYSLYHKKTDTMRSRSLFSAVSWT